ncbi:hypothetical protein [Neisseria bergeri]|uniref:hypothetical protein n=1 Tax=Neisseria bergeri TaxID=1906581 RepID=UPI000E591EE2|nr:hypothetical protein [Neisseria bergeri]
MLIHYIDSVPLQADGGGKAGFQMSGLAARLSDGMAADSAMPSENRLFPFAVSGGVFFVRTE